ncbi:hypothetical protein [Bacteroides acidifaciens]|jgi:hypothetical protein|uniref:hypothetical protein n=1 Tax=Bacteroides acidifaciens TaxID=85831 RepID=UPI0025B3DEB5|nr:hypothetical protein [Bacteroides acidifaciens]
MEKIVQLREYEYNALKEKADMNQAAIDKAMEKEIKKSCNVTIELEMNVGRDWNDVFSIKPYVAVSSGSYNPYNSIEPPKVLSYEACKKLAVRIQRWMAETVEKRYGFSIEQVNKYRRANENRWKWNTLFLILSLSGWLVALFMIFK